MCDGGTARSEPEFGVLPSTTFHTYLGQCHYFPFCSWSLVSEVSLAGSYIRNIVHTRCGVRMLFAVRTTNPRLGCRGLMSPCRTAFTTLILSWSNIFPHSNGWAFNC